MSSEVTWNCLDSLARARACARAGGRRKDQILEVKADHLTEYHLYATEGSIVSDAALKWKGEFCLLRLDQEMLSEIIKGRADFCAHFMCRAPAKPAHDPARDQIAARAPHLSKSVFSGFGNIFQEGGTEQGARGGRHKQELVMEPELGLVGNPMSRSPGCTANSCWRMDAPCARPSCG